jgi:hypothetical protein
MHVTLRLASELNRHASVVSDEVSIETDAKALGEVREGRRGNIDGMNILALYGSDGLRGGGARCNERRIARSVRVHRVEIAIERNSCVVRNCVQRDIPEPSYNDGARQRSRVRQEGSEEVVVGVRAKS